MCNKLKFLLLILLLPIFAGSKINAMVGTGNLCVQRAAELEVAQKLFQCTKMELDRQNEFVRGQAAVRAFFQSGVCESQSDFMNYEIWKARQAAALAKFKFENAQELLKCAQDRYRYAEMAIDLRNADIISNRIALDADHKLANKLFEKHATLPYCSKHACHHYFSHCASVRFEIAD